MTTSHLLTIELRSGSIILFPSPAGWMVNHRLLLLEPWRRLLPFDAGLGQIKTFLIERLHVDGIECTGVRRREVGWNRGDIEVGAIPLGIGIHAIDIPDALIEDQRVDRPRCDRQCRSFRLFVLRSETTIANDVD